MKYEFIKLQNVRFIGIAKEIAMTKGPEECPKFWNHFFQEYVKPVINGAIPNAIQKAIIDNQIGKYAVCDCNRAIRNCSRCGDTALYECGGKFRYIIAGTYECGDVPEGMILMDLPDGEWIKFHFEGGMSDFKGQYQLALSECIQNLKDIADNIDMIVEWYDGNDITSLDFRCGVMLHIKS